MPRILYWNVNNFSSPRIDTTNRKRNRDDDEWNGGPRGQALLDLILDTLQPTFPGTANVVPLDFIVVVEVFQRTGPAIEGEVVGGKAATGCETLRQQIDNALPGTWHLVPPVVTGMFGQREAVAVFYNSAAWFFLGPRTLAADYPGGWPAVLPSAPGAPLASRTIPAGYPYGPVPAAPRPERRSAGQYRFPSGPPVAIGPQPPEVMFPGVTDRKPWLTAFGDVNNVNHLVRIMSLHTSPGVAAAATTNVADVWTMTGAAPDAAQQVDVILGDFNVDNLAAATFGAGGPLARLVGVGPNPVAPAYTALIRPPAGLAAAHGSYYHTHGRPVGQAVIADDYYPNHPYVRRRGNYPGLAYSDESIDNVLVRYQGAVPPAAHNTTILARVREQPYQQPAPPPPPAQMPMLGHYDSLVYMADTIAGLMSTWNNSAPIAGTTDINAEFRSWDYYKRIHDASDHFAVLVDV